MKRFKAIVHVPSAGGDGAERPLRERMTKLFPNKNYIAIRAGFVKNKIPDFLKKSGI